MGDGQGWRVGKGSNAFIKELYKLCLLAPPVLRGRARLRSARRAHHFVFAQFQLEDISAAHRGRLKANNPVQKAIGVLVPPPLPQCQCSTRGRFDVSNFAGRTINIEIGGPGGSPNPSCFSHGVEDNEEKKTTTHED